MKIIKTAIYRNDRGPSTDDQPNFKNRDVSGEGTSLFGKNEIVPDGTDEIIEKWKKNKKKSKSKKKPTIPRNSI